MNIEGVHCRLFISWRERTGWLVDWLLCQLVIKLLFLPQTDKILFHSTGEAVNIFREVISAYFENDPIHINALYGKTAIFF
jgi:hypothetical protein